MPARRPQDATAGRATSDGGPSAEPSEPPAQHQRREEEQRGEKRSRETSTPPTKTWTKSGSAHDSHNLTNREDSCSAPCIPGRLHTPTSGGASRGDPGRPATAGDQRSAHKRRPRPDHGLGPRKVHPSISGRSYVCLTRGTDQSVPQVGSEPATPS